MEILTSLLKSQNPRLFELEDTVNTIIQLLSFIEKNIGDQGS